MSIQETEVMKVVIDDVTYLAEPGTVLSTFLGFEDHGIFTAFLTFEGDWWHQSESARIRTPEQLEEYLKNVIKLFKVSKWDEVVGKNALLLRENGLGAILGMVNPETGKHLLF